MAMGFGQSSSGLFFFIFILVALLVPRVYVRLGLTAEHAQIEEVVASSNIKVSKQVKICSSAKGFSTASMDRLQKCARSRGMSVQARLRSIR